MKTNKNLLGQEHPWEQLEQQAAEANFVVISGIAVDVDDLIGAIDGKGIDPILTRAELNTAYASEESGFLERVGEGMKRRIRNLKLEKNRRIAVLLREYSVNMGGGVTDIKLPRREQILIALSEGRLMYSSLVEFLGQFAQLTEEDIDVVVRAVDEVKGDLTEVSPASHISGQKIQEILSLATIEEIEQTLATTGLGNFPIFLLERAILEIPPHEDDYQYFEEIRADRGVQVGFVVESAAGTAAFAFPLLAFAGSIASIGTGWFPPEMIEVVVGPTGISVLGGGAAIKLAQTFSKWTPVTDRLRASAHTRALRRSSSSLREKYQELAGSIEELKDTAVGSLKLLDLKEFILAQRDGGDREAARLAIEAWLLALNADSSLAAQFEDFAGTRKSDLTTFAGAQKVWKEFPNYQAAARSLPEVSAEGNGEGDATVRRRQTQRL